MDHLWEGQFVMEDGNTVKTSVIYIPDKNSIKHCLDPFLQHGADMIVGFDIQWSSMSTTTLEGMTCFLGVGGVLLKLCTHLGCVLIKLEQGSDYTYLSRFLVNKDIVFAGVHIKEDLKMLQENFKLQILNTVDLSELAADARKQRRIRVHWPILAYGVRDLSREILNQEMKPKSSSITWDDWNGRYTMEQIESATFDAYAAYKVAKKLISLK